MFEGKSYSHGRPFTSWAATPHTSIHKTNYKDVILTNTAAKNGVEFNVMRASSATATADFFSRGTPTLYIGSYPAFKADTYGGVQVRNPCLTRIMLAANDIVIASWCAPDALTPAHAQQLEGILATYQNHSVSATANCNSQWIAAYRDWNTNQIILGTWLGKHWASSVLSDTTASAPTLTCFKGQVFVAFVPNDGSKHITVFYGGIPVQNTCTVSIPCTYTERYTVAMNGGAQNTTAAAPSLSSDGINLYMVFTGTANPGHVNMAQTTDGTTAASWIATTLPITSSGAPSTVGCGGKQWVTYADTSSPTPHIVLATSSLTYVLDSPTIAVPTVSCYYGLIVVNFLVTRTIFWILRNLDTTGEPR